LTKCKTREQHAKVRQNYGQSFHDALVLGAHAQSIARDTFDHKESVSAFIEKRPLRFQGRQRCALTEDQLMPGVSCVIEVAQREGAQRLWHGGKVSRS